MLFELASHIFVCRQLGDTKKSMIYANKAVNASNSGKLQLLVRGALYHAQGKDTQALIDLSVTLLLYTNM